MGTQVSVAAQVRVAAQLGVAAQPQVRMAAPRSGWRCGQGGGAGWGVGVAGQVQGRSRLGWPRRLAGQGARRQLGVLVRS